MEQSVILDTRDVPDKSGGEAVRKAEALQKENFQVKAHQMWESHYWCISNGILYCQVRSGDLEGFFSYENQATPPPLSMGGEIQFGTKADLLECFKVDKF